MSDKIEEIRDRVEQDVAKGPANEAISRVHKDRAFLLAEVDRLRAEIERLRENVDRAGKEVERADRLRAEIARVKSDERENRAEIKRLRAALKNIAALDPDVPDALVADALRGIVALMGDLARKALEGKP